MIKTGILHPQINSLLARVRHTNLLVIADRGFPFWPMIETVDISLVDNLPTVLQVFEAVQPNFQIGEIFMAQEFLAKNSVEARERLVRAIGQIPISYVPHDDFKKRVPQAIGLIRTADTIQYSNMILVSA